MIARILNIGFVLFSFVLTAQVQGGQNTVTNNASVPQEPTMQQDSTVLNEVEIQSTGKKKSERPQARYKTLEKSAAVEMDKTVSSEAVIMDASAGFEQSKGMASRQRIQRTPTVSQQRAMDEAVTSLEKSAPNSFEYHYYKYLAGNYDVSLIDDLDQAEKIRPNNADVQVQKVAYHHIKKENSKTKEYLNKLVASNRLNEKLKYYAEDLLLSVPKNGTLVTHGFDDTYSVLYAQLQLNVRTDVRVISLDMLQSEAYKETLKKEGYKFPSGSVIDVSFFSKFAAMNESKNIAVSLTTPKEYFKSIQGNLYLSGLVFEYHKEDYDNLHRNQTLWDKKLKKYAVNNATDDKLKELSSNYLPMLLLLYKNYKENGEQAKLEEIDSALSKVSVQCGKYETVKRLKDSY